MSHHHVQGLDGVEWNLASPALQSLLQSVERDLGIPLDGHPEDSVLALPWQRHVQLQGVVPDGQWLPGVHVVPAVKDRLQIVEYFPVGVNHRLYDVSVDLAGAFVRLDIDQVVMDVASGHRYLNIALRKISGYKGRAEETFKDMIFGIIELIKSVTYRVTSFVFMS